MSEDPDALECCVPYCDLDAPSCPEPLSCGPLFVPQVEPPGLANIGDCGQDPG